MTLDEHYKYRDKLERQMNGLRVMYEENERQITDLVFKEWVLKKQQSLIVDGSIRC
jgi:hypothetical protein